MYCNYSKDKFGNELTFIIPSWLDCKKLQLGLELTNGNSDEWVFYNACRYCENTYLRLLEEGWKPQQARAVLPNATKTEVVMTGFVSNWRHFFSLRTSIIAETGKPHPDVSALADPLYKEFIKGGYMEPLV